MATVGDQTLIQGDFFHIWPQVPDGSVDLIVTDPPYGVLRRMYPWDQPIDPGFLAGILNQLVAPKGIIALICNAAMIPELVLALSRHFKYRYLEVWLKPSAQVKHKDRPRPDADFVLVFDRKGVPKRERIYNWEEVAEQGVPYVRVNRNLRNATMLTSKREVDRNPTGTRHPSTVIPVRNRPNMTKEEKAGVDHPQQKDLAAVTRLIRLLSHPGQLILDPFMGSGTTLVACHRTGRKGIGFELREEFFEMAKARLEQETAQGVLI